MTLDELLLEWSYRSERGYPCLDSPSDISVLKQILEELELPTNEIISNLVKHCNEKSLSIATGEDAQISQAYAIGVAHTLTGTPPVP